MPQRFTPSEVEGKSPKTDQTSYKLLHTPSRESMSNDLKQFGVTRKEADRLNLLSPQERTRELRQGLEAYTQEVLADSPVSTLYHYWTDHENSFYTAPPEPDGTFKEIYSIDNQFDPRERNGIPQAGFSEVRKRIVENPDAVILWYSPPGPASFDSDQSNPYNQIQYDDGQLYVHYYDGEKICAAAVKINHNGAVLNFTGSDVISSSTTPTTEEITRSLMTPIVFEGSIDQYLDQARNNIPIYTDKKGYTHTTAEVVNLIRSTFAGTRNTPGPFLLDKTIDALEEYEITETRVLSLYLETIQRYMQHTGVQTLQLRGSCGGSLVTLDGVAQLLSELLQSPSLPSVSQILNPAGSAMRTLNAGERYHDYHCPHCQTLLQGELKGKPDTWKTECPHCHKNIRCT